MGNIVHEDLSNYGITDDHAEAERRWKLWREKDPFEDTIRASLLSKKDIEQYVRVTGLLCPFRPDERRLKSASYEAWPTRFVRWDEKGHKIIDDVDRADYERNGYELKENSITFMQI